MGVSSKTGGTSPRSFLSSKRSKTSRGRSHRKQVGLHLGPPLLQKDRKLRGEGLIENRWDFTSVLPFFKKIENFAGKVSSKTGGTSPRSSLSSKRSKTSRGRPHRKQVGLHLGPPS